MGKIIAIVGMCGSGKSIASGYLEEIGYKKVYLKSDLVNYYEKFGAIYIDKLKNGENLYYIELDDKIF